MGFTIKKGSEKGSQKGSEKGVSRRCLERPPVEYAPLGVRPINSWLVSKLFGGAAEPLQPDLTVWPRPPLHSYPQT